MLKIHKVGEEGARYLKILIYGPSGVGKTVMSATALKPLILNAEGGLLSIREKGKDLECIKIEKFEDLEEAYDYLKNEKHSYKSVVLDSITDIHRRCVEYIQTKHTHEIATLQDWAHITERMRKLVRAFRDLDIHVIMTALSEDVKDETTGSIMKKPNMYGKFPDEVCAYMDIVGYLAAKEDKEKGTLTRWLAVQPTERFYAKDRSSKLDRYIELKPDEPYIQMIIERIFTKEKKEK